MVLNSEKSNTGFLTHNQLLVFTVGLMLSVSIITASNYGQQTANAQGQQPNPKATLSFFLKLGNNQSTSAASSQAASNGTGTKNVTITVNVQKGSSGSPMKLPISAVVPKNVNTQDLQLCASLANGQQKCQPLTQNAPNIDLSSASSGAATTTPQAYHDDSSVNNILNVLSNSIIQFADAQLISVNNTTLNIPITVIVPITLEIQNAQICASVASSGGVSCQQLVLNPTQSAFTPVNVDLANPTTPTVTTASVPSTQQLTGGATGSNNTAGTGTNNTAASTGTNNTSGTSGGGTSGGTNSTSTQGTSPSSTTTSNQPSSTTQQPTSSEPTQDNTKNKKNNDNKNNGNSGKNNP